jgi:hypothetical protein
MGCLQVVPEASRPAYTRAHDLYRREAALPDGFAQQHVRFIMWWGMRRSRRTGRPSCGRPSARC